MHNFLLATGNAHKSEEFNKIFDSKIICVSSAPSKLEVVEDGQTFFDNALIKARAYYDKFQKPILSDDSGLCVEALPNELAVQSARFGGEGLNDKDRALLLLEKMKDQDNRKAYFVCVLCFYLDPKNIFYFEGRMEGIIASSYEGEHGFGYDPVFKPLSAPHNLSVAQLPEWKDENSHRARACKQAQIFFRERNCQTMNSQL